MGMDVYGLNPTTKRGKSLDGSWSWSMWEPLVAYCSHAVPELWGKIQNPFSDSGEGLDAEDSKRLAARLRARIAEGHTSEWRQGLEAWCEGKGYTRHRYVFSVDTVEQFITFLDDCGGFAIRDLLSRSRGLPIGLLRQV